MVDSMAKQMEQPTYPKSLFKYQMEELDLFDNLLHREVKDFHDDDDIEVEIKDLECDIAGYCRTSFKFKLMNEHEVILEYPKDKFVYFQLKEWIEREADWPSEAEES